MRVAIIAEVFLPKIDGVVHRTVNLIRELARRDDQVLVVCPQAEGPKECPATVHEVRSFPCPPYPEYRVGLPDRRLAKEVGHFAPDVLHYINPFAFGFRCYEVLQRAGLGLPSVFSFHTLYGEFVKGYRSLAPLSPVLWWLMREYHNRADLNITVSSLMQEELIRRGFERVHCWPPAVDSRLFHPGQRSQAMRERLTRGRPERPLLLTVSRLAPEKNVALLAEVLAQVPEACLAVVGDGPQRGELEQRFAGLDAHFVGYLKGAELAAAYASADAFLYASETETMGNVVLEGMACGCAVIVPRAGGIPSLVDDGKTGLLYPPRSVADAVRLTRQVLAEPALCAALGQNARQTVETWTWENSVERVRLMYQEAIEHYRPGPARRGWKQGLAHLTLLGLVSTFQLGAALTPSRSPRS